MSSPDLRASTVRRRSRGSVRRAPWRLVAWLFVGLLLALQLGVTCDSAMAVPHSAGPEQAASAMHDCGQRQDGDTKHRVEHPCIGASAILPAPVSAGLEPIEFPALVERWPADYRLASIARRPDLPPPRIV